MRLHLNTFNNENNENIVYKNTKLIFKGNTKYKVNLFLTYSNIGNCLYEPSNFGTFFSVMLNKFYLENN